MKRRPRSESNYRSGNPTPTPPIRGRQTDADTGSELIFSPPIHTETTEAQLRLARSEEHLRLMFTEMMSAVALHEIVCDANGQPVDYRFIDVNPMFEKMVGRARTEIIGKSVMAVMPAAERDWIEHYYGRVARTGVHEQFESYAASLGKYYEVRAYSPEPGMCAVIYNDITERKRAEQAIRESELRYRSVIEHTAEGVLIVDTQTKRILEANRAFCAMLGWTLAELQAQLFYTIITGNLEEVNTNIYQMIDSDLPLTGQQQFIAKDGKLVEAEFSASILEMSGKRLLVMVVRDMTDRRKIEEARVRLEKMESLGIMAGGIAHDFNNLLHVVLGQTAMALGHVGLGTAASDHLEKARKAAMRAAGLTQKLLSYSGMGSISAERVNLNDVIKTNLAALQSALPSDVRLELRLDDALRAVEGDREHLQQVVMNLVTNAGEAMAGKSGTVIVSTSMEEVFAWDTGWAECTGEELEPGFYAVLEVKDDGCGMTKETMAKLFDPFFSTKFSGRGLGLAAVYGIVRGHRGGLLLESEEGKGTTFRIAFPAAEAGTNMPAPETLLDQIQPATGMVLIVDDEDLVRDVVSDILENNGIRCITAAGGEEAIARYNDLRGEINVVLLDLSMPGVSGAETFKRLKAIDPRVNIVLSSGYSESDVRAKFPELGGVGGFIQKPYQSEALIEKLSPYCAKQ